MPFVPAPDCASAAIKFNVNGQICYNVLNFLHDGPYGQVDITALANAIDDWVGTEYLQAVTSEVQYMETSVRGLSSTEDLVAISTTSAGNGLVGSTEALPANVTLAIKFTTGLTGRSNRGRAYLIGLPVSYLDANENFISSSAASGIVTLWQDMNGYIDTIDWEHIVLSKFTDGAPRTEAVARKVITYSFTDLKIDTMRKRMN